jgi:hypothetical protein
LRRYNLVSPHQRIMLDLTYLNDAEHREKYNVILCSRINKMVDGRGLHSSTILLM